MRDAGEVSAEGRSQVDPLGACGASEARLRQQRRASDGVILFALRQFQVGDLDLGILLQCESDRVSQS